MVDELGQERNSSCIHYELGQLGWVFAYLAQSRCGNSLEGGFGFLDAEDQEGDSSDFHNRHGQLGGVLSDVGEGPGCSFLDGGVELFEADH